MTSQLNVDTLRKANGSVPTAGGLGLNITGSILQVKYVVISGFSTTNDSLTDITGATLSITPTSATTIMLVEVSGVLSNAGSNYVASVQLLKGSTTVNGATQQINQSGGAIGSNVNIRYFDDHNATDAITYKLQLRSESSGQTARFGLSSSGASTYVNSNNLHTVPVLTIKEIGG